MVDVMNLHRASFFFRCAALLGGLCAAGTSAAEGSQALSVSATILSKNTCHFTNGGPTLLSFGAIEPSMSAPATVTATTTFRCKGADPVVSYFISSDDGLSPAAPGQPRMRHASQPLQFLPYRLEFPQAGTAAKNVTRTLTVTGRIEPADFANALVGSYADSVVLTIEP